MFMSGSKKLQCPSGYGLLLMITHPNRSEFKHHRDQISKKSHFSFML